MKEEEQMIRLKVWLSTVSLIGTLIILQCPLPAFGSGFGIFTQGASALGQADSVVAHADGPSTVFFNPALMNTLPGTQVEIGTTLLFPNRNYTATDGTTASTKDTVFTPSTFYLTHAFNDKISAGLGVFNPFGLGSDWGGDWGGPLVPGSGGLGRFIATKSEMTSWNINPVASYKVCQGFSLAAGLDIVLLDATLKRKGLDSSTFTEYNQKFTGDGNGIGYNVGLFIQPTDNLSFGASYRSQVDIDATGSFSADGLPQSIGAKTTIKLPQQVFAGIAYKPVDSLTLEAGMRWEDWSVFKELQIQFDQNPFGLTSSAYPRSWHSTFAMNAGGKYKVNSTFSMMVGYLYGWNPVPDSTFEPAIPDSNTHLFCIGGEAKLDKLTFAMSYAYQLQEDRTKSTNLYSNFANGSYNSDMHLLGLSLGYRF
jgi:long-chain fatty acid transport protein